ncbi:ENV1 protein, partial [Scytalopus superciliaris]|nr:ENV1 protein [Scytalopus superciliaris]
MAKLREGLEKRKREQEAQQNCFSSWMNHSPWLATLISTLVGPIVTILLVLIFGLCVLNKLVSFVRNRLEKVNIMVAEQ